MEPTTIITEAELLDKLKNSRIDKAQQKELETMIPGMNQDDRVELMKLIEQANREGEMAPTETPAEPAPKTKSNRVLLNVILLAVALLLIASGILYALNYI